MTTTTTAAVAATTTASLCTGDNDPMKLVHSSLQSVCFSGSTFRPELVDAYDWTLYPWNVVTLLILMWLLGELLYRFLNRVAPTTFNTLDVAKKRIVVTYFAQLLMQTASIYIVVRYGYGDYSYEDFRMLRVSLALLGVVYVWELTYRTEIGWPLLMHHIITLVLLQLAVLSIQDTHNIMFVRMAVVMGLHANTEQCAMLALLFYRFQWRLAARFFVLAAGQALVIKTMIFAASWYIFREVVRSSDIHSRWIRFWYYAFPVLNSLLFFSQMYAVHILTCLAWRAFAIDNEQQQKQQQQQQQQTATMKVTGDDKQRRQLPKEVSPPSPLVIMDVDEVVLPMDDDDDENGVARRRRSTIVENAVRKLGNHMTSMISDQSVLDEHVGKYF